MAPPSQQPPTAVGGGGRWEDAAFVASNIWDSILDSFTKASDCFLPLATWDLSELRPTKSGAFVRKDQAALCIGTRKQTERFT